MWNPSVLECSVHYSLIKKIKACLAPIAPLSSRGSRDSGPLLWRWTAWVEIWPLFLTSCVMLGKLVSQDLVWIAPSSWGLVRRITWTTTCVHLQSRLALYRSSAMLFHSDSLSVPIGITTLYPSRHVSQAPARSSYYTNFWRDECGISSPELSFLVSAAQSFLTWLD